MISSIILPTNNSAYINPFNGFCSNGISAYNVLMQQTSDRLPDNYYSVTENISLQKDYLNLLKKIKKIDPEAKEILESPMVGTPGTYNSLMIKSFLSEKIWLDKRLKIFYSVKGSHTSTLSVYKDMRYNGISIKLYACYDLPLITRMGLDHVIQNTCFLENVNNKIAKTVFKELSLLIKNNQLKISSDSDISNMLKNYLNFL